MSSEAPRSLHAKLAEVMGEISRVPKNGRNEFHKYDYVTEADLVEAVRDKLASRGVTLIPSAESVDRDGNLAFVRMTFTFVDAGSGETVSSSWFGSGEDKGDKALYKAYTGALKYFLMKTFLIATGDDPERDNPETTRKAAAETPQPRVKATPEQVEKVVSAAFIIGVEDKLQLAAQHVHSGTVGDCATVEAASKSLAALSPEELDRVYAWCEGKHAEAAAE